MNMIEVTKGAFFKAVSGPESIHPHPEQAQVDWVVVGTGRVIGKSTPGFKRIPGKDGKPAYPRYYLGEAFAKAKNIQPREIR